MVDKIKTDVDRLLLVSKMKQKVQFLKIYQQIFFHYQNQKYTVKNFSEIFPKTFGQLKAQIGRKFFQRYSQKCFWHRTGNIFYYLVGEISSLLRKIDLFHNLSEKRLKKVNKFPFLWNNFRFSWKKFLTTQEICEMFSPSWYIS